jgi:phosphatidylglycerophosphate synthase
MRAVSQPETLMGRRSAEHWAGRLYMRRISLHVSRLLVPTRVTPNQLTLLMIVVGWLGALAAAFPGVATALGAALLIQGYLLLDCSDGEVARWRGATSALGVYLDRLGHYVVEAALLIALGVRAGGGPTALSGWTTLGVLGALLAVLSKAETDLVVVARAGAGLPATEEREALSRSGVLRGLRQLIAAVPFHRMIGAVELSLLLVVAAVVDAVTADLLGSRLLLVAAVATGAVVAAGHPVTIATSERLR